jgi:DNA polymerase III delta prime subunit
LDDIKRTELDELKNEIIELKKQISLLKESLLYLSAAKLSNPKYPYWNYLIELELGIYESKAKIEYVLSVLSERLSGKKIILTEVDELSSEMIASNDIFATKTKANLFPEELFETSVPEYKDAINILLKIIESKDEEIIFKLLLSIYQQGMFKELIKHLLTPA